jgi:ABC-type phosphate transport system auxiliary subunit
MTKIVKIKVLTRFLPYVLSFCLVLVFGLQLIAQEQETLTVGEVLPFPKEEKALEASKIQKLELRNKILEVEKLTLEIEKSETRRDALISIINQDINDLYIELKRDPKKEGLDLKTVTFFSLIVEPR